MSPRQVAIVVPARDEADRIEDCLRHLTQMERDRRVRRLVVFILANNCADDTALAARRFASRTPVEVRVTTQSLEPERAHAGWARRLAFDAGAESLEAPGDLLLSTDADTRVARDWLVRTLDHMDAGYDAVAGHAVLDPRELRRLDPSHRRRLAAIRRYEDAIRRLKALRCREEPWPRHFYEGGASMAVRLDAYRAIGGAPTPPVGEDKALFAALRARGARIRHPLDVRVATSCRLVGRAQDGAADTLARWGAQTARERLIGLAPLASALGHAHDAEGHLTFETLAEETERARALLRALRGETDLRRAG